MKYFSSCRTIHEAKIKFRQLSKIHHPDMGGDSKIMAQITNEYDQFQPSQPEHTNFFRQNQFYGNFQRFERFTDSNQSKSYEFKGNIPFDHPIHEELRQNKAEIQRLKDQIQEDFENYNSRINVIKNFNVNQSQKLLEIESRIMRLLGENQSLKTQNECKEQYIEELLRESTLWEFIKKKIKGKI